MQPLLMSGWVKAGVLDKGDKNVKALGSSRTGLESTDLDVIL